MTEPCVYCDGRMKSSAEVDLWSSDDKGRRWHLQCLRTWGSKYLAFEDKKIPSPAKGFTNSSMFQEILRDKLRRIVFPGSGRAEYIPLHYIDGKLPGESVSFTNVTLEDLKRLLDAIPDDAQFKELQYNNSPDTEGFIAIGEKYEGVIYEGEVLGESRMDERLGVSTILVPFTPLTPQDIMDLKDLEADEFSKYEKDEEIFLRLWWD